MTTYDSHGECDYCEADMLCLAGAKCSGCGATVGLTRAIRWDAGLGRYVEVAS